MKRKWIISEQQTRARVAGSVRSCARASAGFTLIESMIATALLGFSLVVMFGFHSQAVRSNLHARKMTDCTYLAQLQMERLIALPWSESSRPGELADLDDDDSSSDKWTYLPHPSGGPSAVNSYNQEDDDGGESVYYVSWDIEAMDSDATWLRMRVRCQYNDTAFNQWKGTTISSYRFRDS
jgi:prepilin-type N-terminal cleavage/methylation domain-containing protein